jgi:hypothetical protein
VIRLLKFALFAVVFLAALLIGHHNAQASWSVGPMQQAADSIKGAPVTVVCNGAGSAYEGWAYVIGNEVWLGEYACADTETGRGPGMLILLHELGHATGIANERAATCFGLQHLRPVLQRFYGFSARRAQVEYRAAVVFMRAQLDPSYWCAT